MDESLRPYRYRWPRDWLRRSPHWRPLRPTRFLARSMPEPADELAGDSRWPAFFPSPISLVTTTDGSRTGLEKVVAATVVNRFPYVLAVSLCRQPLSQRHHVRREFMNMLERSGSAAVQFLPPGADLDRVIDVIQSVPDERTDQRVAHCGLQVRDALTGGAPVFESAYMVYEARLAEPGRDFQGDPIYSTPWIDAGSHRVYFLEIKAIQLREDIARGRSQIHWRALPAWAPRLAPQPSLAAEVDRVRTDRYQKGYTPHYVFPSAGTAAFEADAIENGMAVKHLPPLPQDQVEVDNDRARWPCFFPSSAGMITTWAAPHVPNVMPCGSTMVVSRHPLIVAPCISYAAINERYAPRGTLDLVRRAGRFGCSVPFAHDCVVNAITYTGNISIRDDRDKIAHAGLGVYPADRAPVLSDLPVHFDCEVAREVRLGTHAMFLGQVRRILVRDDVSPQNPLDWCPWAAIRSVKPAEDPAPVTPAAAV
ncbi:MAG: flavin reductase [Phycisphaerales bacterium]|nr:MAG: flavin reductase [Phycisphaerales bacterium]